MMDLGEFERCGYGVVRGVVSESEADRFLREAVCPALMEQGIDLLDASSWPGRVVGVRVCGDDGHPIVGKDKRWPELFDSDLLRKALDALHGGRRWRWFAGAVDGVGWIHLRFPLEDREEWIPPKDGWHLDETLTSLVSESSVILLPVVTALRGGGGGTAMLRGSHSEIADALRAAGGSAVDWDRVHAYMEGFLKPAMLRRDPEAIVEAKGEPGDVLVLHPLLYHAASDATRNSGVRVTFNLAVHHENRSTNPIDRCLVGTGSPAVLRYGEPFFLKFLQHRGLLFQNGERRYCTGERDFLPTSRGDVEAFAVIFVSSNRQRLLLGDTVRCGDSVLLRRFFGSSGDDEERDSDELRILGVEGLPVGFGDGKIRLLLCASESRCLTANPTDEEAPLVSLSSPYSENYRKWQQLTVLNFLRPSMA